MSDTVSQIAADHLYRPEPENMPDQFRNIFIGGDIKQRRRQT
jgi:hypothetical protein